MVPSTKIIAPARKRTTRKRPSGLLDSNVRCTAQRFEDLRERVVERTIDTGGQYAMELFDRQLVEDRQHVEQLCAIVLE